MKSRWILAIIMICIVFVTALGGLYLTLPDSSILASQYPNVQAHQKVGDFRVTWQKAPPPSWVRLNSIPKYIPGAIVVSEDWSFWDHKGVDWAELFLVLRKFVTEGGRLRGASTLTQQVAKNLFLDRHRKFLRKIREWMIVGEMESQVSKEKILETYINIVEFGPGIYGLQKASLHYFEKPAHDLSPLESAFLTMLLPNPRGYRESFVKGERTPFAAKRMKQILIKMQQAGHISQDQLEIALEQRLPFEPQFFEEEFYEESPGEFMEDDPEPMAYDAERFPEEETWEEEDLTSPSPTPAMEPEYSGSPSPIPLLDDLN